MNIPRPTFMRGIIAEMFLLRPGFVRGVAGLTIGAAMGAFGYRAFAMGGIYAWAAVFLLVQGFLLSGPKGIALALLFHIPIHVLLHFPVPPQTAEFGTLLVALIVYLAIIPGGYVQMGFLQRGIPGAAFSALLIVPGYVTFLVAFPPPLGAGPVVGSLFMFGGFGAAFGFLWGVGAIAPGASAHEGPTYWADVEASKAPKITVRSTLEFLRRRIPPIVAFVRPLIQPLAVGLGAALIIVVILTLIATNPIVRVSRPQTNDAAASALAVTGDKLLTFGVLAMVTLGGVAGLAFGLALLMRYANNQVALAKKEKNAPIEQPPGLVWRLMRFFVNWVVDILSGIQKTFQR
jgi:hypothetical protein